MNCPKCGGWTKTTCLKCEKEVVFGPLTVRGRYLNDAEFRTLVDTMHSFLDQSRFTPTEIREAAMLAQIMYEERNPRPITFTREDVMKGRVKPIFRR